jgi:hypothetical protein
MPQILDYMYNVTLWYNCTTIVADEEQQILHILQVCCSLQYPACMVHVAYCLQWPVPLYIFPHYLVNSTIKKKVIEHEMCVLIFFTTSAQNTSHSKKN